MDGQHRHPRFLAIGDFSLGRSSREDPGKGSAARRSLTGQEHTSIAAGQGISLRRCRANTAPVIGGAMTRLMGAFLGSSDEGRAWHAPMDGQGPGCRCSWW
jgi:hypothetical protein